MTIRPLLARHLLGMGTIAVALAAAGSACAQTNQSATGSITVMQPVLNVTKNTDLNFGSVIRPTSGSGTIIIDANSGNVSTSNLAQANGNTPTRANFTVEGQPNANINVTYPNNVTLTRAGGSETLTVYLTSSMGGGQIGGGGTVQFNIGGQVTLSSSTVIGAYSNSFTVTVAYN
ncbi:DUF4402 domain-containing protein [Phenylobacterium sp. J367]|uniref:DUF4402 domain-containing protein n=1 Tax=Phenylobacterium sp. J367 TaxID=2898435 RepID=UPI002151526F|nr:DUF4402 domain-containing protein [Phenylobacterium sp. J367]MCR5879204.1 DUF4402 domain-containing protein [Phenylobacterium sp. J367]